MAQWIDFKALRDKLDFSKVLKHYGVSLNVKGDQASGFCPLPTHRGVGRSPSFSVNLKRGIWQCFGCGRRGNVFDFAIQMEGHSTDDSNAVRTVALRLCDLFQIEGVVKDREVQETTTPPQTKSPQSPAQGRLPPRPATTEPSQSAFPSRINQPLDFELKGLDPNHPYLLKRGFTPETIAHFGLGYCSRGYLAGRIAIPLHDADGRLIGYAGRIVNDSTISAEHPKYKFPSRRERDGVIHEFRKSAILYNLHRLRRPLERLVVVEGFPSVWWLHQHGVQNVIALMGWSCSPEQTKLIVEATLQSGHVLVLPDADEAGTRCAAEILHAVAYLRWVRWLVIETGKQPTDLTKAELYTVFPM
jgi:DNA primase